MTTILKGPLPADYFVPKQPLPPTDSFYEKAMELSDKIKRGEEHD